MTRTPDSTPGSTAVSTSVSAREDVHAEVRFLKNAVPADGGDVPFLLRLHGRLPERDGVRTPIDLALVLDRSGSMRGQPLEAAKMAAHDAVDLLEEGDRLAIVVYDDQVDVLVPTTLVDDRATLHTAIDRIDLGGSTALHAGWTEGAAQLVDLLDPARTARVVLLTDGQANQGVVDPHEIAADVARMAAHGVATSAIGLGRSFNEDLLARVADAGGGRFAHAETPVELEGVMAAELIGIDATVARRVRARFHADGVAGEIVDMLNDFIVDGDELALPDLVAELPLDVVGVLHVRPAKPHLDRSLGAVELAWTDVEGHRRGVTLDVNAVTLPTAEYAAAEEDPDVAIAVAVLTAARHRQAAMEAIDRGDDVAVKRELADAERVLAAAPDVDRMRRELASLDRVREAFHVRDYAMARKRASAQSGMSRSGFDSLALSATERSASKQESLRTRRAARAGRNDDVAADSGHGPGPWGGGWFGAPRRHGVVAPTHEAKLEVARPDGSVGVMRLRRGDITEWACDAIVNPTNPRLHGTGASVDGAVHRRGGMQLTRECRAIGHVGVGEAVVTKGWDLPAEYVLHTASPAYDGTDRSLDLLASCYRSSLVLARQLRLKRVAFPAIGAGSNGFTTRVAAEVALREIVAGLADPAGPDEIEVVLFDRRAYTTYERVVERRQRKPDQDAHVRGGAAPAS